MGAKAVTSNKSAIYEADIKFLCGMFSHQLLKIFSDKPEIILTTPAHRRQVWYAVLSSSYGKNELTLADQLQFTKSRALIEMAFGTCPSFMFTILKRIGVKPQHTSWYNDLHSVLSKNPTMGHDLVNSRHLSIVIENLAKLPTEMQNVSFAGRFHHTDRVDEFLVKLDALCKIAKIEDKTSFVAQKINQGCDPHSIIKDIYYKIKFQPPVLADEENLEYLGSVQQLRDASHKFNNCLMDRVDQAFCNAHQHYMLSFGDECIVFSIQKLADNSWQFYEAEDKTSLFVDGAIEERMNAILHKNNVSLTERLPILAA